jgi:quercetin dioxygenase-like cupin family protein
MFRSYEFFGFMIEELPVKILAPGVRLREAHLDNVMVTFVEFEPGRKVPPHKHPHEQISLCIRGRLKMRVKSETRILEPGQGMLVPANTEHEAESLEDVVIAYDCFCPVREDYIGSS